MHLVTVELIQQAFELKRLQPHLKFHSKSVGPDLSYNLQQGNRLELKS